MSPIEAGADAGKHASMLMGQRLLPAQQALRQVKLDQTRMCHLLALAGTGKETLHCLGQEQSGFVKALLEVTNFAWCNIEGTVACQALERDAPRFDTEADGLEQAPLEGLHCRHQAFTRAGDHFRRS